MLKKLGISLASSAYVASLETWEHAMDVKQLYGNIFA